MKALNDVCKTVATLADAVSISGKVEDPRGRLAVAVALLRRSPSTEHHDTKFEKLVSDIGLDYEAGAGWRGIHRTLRL